MGSHAVKKSTDAIRIGILVDAIRRYGARNLSRLSRITGIPQETVNYKLTKQFPKLGLAVRVSVNYERLGLKRLICEADINPELNSQAGAIFDAMAHHAFLTYQARQLTVPGYSHFLMFAVPVSLIPEFRAFMDGLVSKGVLTRYTLSEISWLRHLSLDPRFYDFANRSWHVNWKWVAETEGVLVEEPLTINPQEKPEMDNIDLYIIKELQANALQKLAIIARKLGVDPKLLRYHFHRHVELVISGYCVGWSRAYKDAKRNLVHMVFIFSGLDEKQLRRARDIFNKVPFTWAEAAGPGGGYHTFLHIDSKHLEETMLFLKFMLGPIQDKAKTIFLDGISPDSNWTYSIPYEMFEGGRWVFRPHEAYEAVTALVEKEKIRGI
jgi:DNA-binding Lrp family transcriptional regulator